jgi:hypothetical protein
MEPAELGEVGARCDAPRQDEEVEGTEEGGDNGTASDVRSRCRSGSVRSGRRRARWVPHRIRLRLRLP